jgi:hypothetical protein
MLRLRFGSIVPPGGVNLAYIPVPPATPSTHLSLADYSIDIPENVANTFGTEDEVDVGASEAVETDEIVLSNRSILSRNVTRPVKLFYRIALQYPVVDDEASVLDLDAAREIIRKHLTILDGENNATTDLGWDLTVDAAGPSPATFLVTLYTDRIGTRGQTFKVRYHALINSQRSPNRREVLNPTQILSAGVEYTLVDDGANGFLITGLSTTHYGPAIGLFKDTGGPASVTVTGLVLDFGGGITVGLQVGGAFRPVKDVVADVNAANVAVTAVALSDAARADLAIGVFTLATTGTALRLRTQAHIRYTDLFRVRPMVPAANNPREPWYPRISKGAFCRFTGARTLRYQVRDFEYQAFSTVRGAPFKEAVFEEPVLLDSQRAQVSKFPIRAAIDVRLFVDGIEDNTLIDQIDLANGILFLTRSIGANTDLRVSYVYEALSYVYQGVNLNPTLRHNPDLLGKYIGVYLIPHKIFSGSGTDTFERTIYHTVRDTAEAIRTFVTAQVLSDGSSAEALLLGIYHVVQTELPEDLDVFDTRTPGGGLREGLIPDDVDEPEARFYGDVGGHWDGEPFPDAGTLLIQIPEGLPGTGQADQRLTLYDSLGTTGTIDPSAWVNPTGLLTEEEIVAEVRRHTDAGALAILDFYQDA